MSDIDWTSPMVEAVCGRCGETFNPSGPDDLTHLETFATGDECGGLGVVTGWMLTRPTPEPRTYVVGLPVLVTIAEDGTVSVSVDLSEAAADIHENGGAYYDPPISDDQADADAHYLSTVELGFTPETVVFVPGWSQ